VTADRFQGGLEACRVFLSTDQSLPAGNRQQISFDSIDFDSDNNFDTSSNSWTCPQDGLFMSNVQAFFESGADGDGRVVRIGTNFDPAPTGEGALTLQSDSSTGDRLSATSITRYSQGDTIGFYARNIDSADSLQGGNGSFATFAEVAFLGGL
jgi:hypothetical protein